MTKKRTIVTHVGISLLNARAFTSEYNGIDTLKDNLLHDPWYDTTKVEQKCRKALFDGLKDCWGDGSEPWRSRQDSPAEIASLSLLNLQPGDRVVLFYSETAAGQFCAHLLEHLLRQNLAPGSAYPFCSPEMTVECKEIKGVRIIGDGGNTLITQNNRDFVRVGLVNYVQAVYKLYRVADGIIFNVTSGYKGLIPIARDLSLLLTTHSRDGLDNPIRIEMCYLYETSDDLVYYGILPATIRLDPLLLNALAQAGSDTGVQRREVNNMDVAWEPFFEMLKHPQAEREASELPVWRPYVNSNCTRDCTIRRSALGEVVHTLSELQEPNER
jgi:hypothetical protein